jgi:hypothetical protein
VNREDSGLKVREAVADLPGLRAFSESNSTARLNAASAFPFTTSWNELDGGVPTGVVTAIKIVPNSNLVAGQSADGVCFSVTVGRGSRSTWSRPLAPSARSATRP